MLVGFDDCRAVVFMPSAACRGWNPDESSQVTGHSESSSGGIRSRRLRRAVEPGLLLILAISVAGTAAALSLDVVGALGSVKGDEATYVMMALSAAHDGDMVYESTDLSRFYRLYQGGPEGLFLKREAGPGAPGQLFFAKAWLHAVVAAPFVRVLGLNGLLVLNVWLLAGAAVAGYLFVAARSPDGVACAFSLAFLCASITPIYVVWLSPEMLNFALVVYAYFFWLYKEVAPPERLPQSRWLAGSRSDLIAAVLLGLATFSKPPNLALFAPLVALYWWRGRYVPGLLVAGVFGLVAAGAFGVNTLMTGEWNYMGGDRRTFYGGAGGFPYEHGTAFDQAGIPMTTNEVTFDEPPDRIESWLVLLRNAGYFLVGRHFGFVPFFFPAVVAVACMLWRRRSMAAWHVLVLGAACGMAAVLLFLLPHSWSGGGGPLGNRYFLSAYGVFLFLAPVMATMWPAVLAWTGGSIFVAHILINPLVSARQTYAPTQQGVLRLLPVELTMVSDLPVNLIPQRRGLQYGEKPEMFLYLLDGHSTPPEESAMWIEGGATAEIIVRTFVPVEVFAVQLSSHVPNTVEVSIGGATETVQVGGDLPVTLRIEPRAVYARNSWLHLLSIRTRDGYVPHLSELDSDDERYLGVQVRLAARATDAPEE